MGEVALHERAVGSAVWEEMQATCLGDVSLSRCRFHARRSGTTAHCGGGEDSSARPVSASRPDSCDPHLKSPKVTSLARSSAKPLSLQLRARSPTTYIPQHPTKLAKQEPLLHRLLSSSPLHLALSLPFQLPHPGDHHKHVSTLAQPAASARRAERATGRIHDLIGSLPHWPIVGWWGGSGA